MQHGVLVLEENAGVVEWWSGGVVEWWSGGVVEWWSGGHPGRTNTPILHYSIAPITPSLRYSITPCCSLEKGVHQARGILNYFLECRTLSPIGE
jgi:hypothetical protein